MMKYILRPITVSLFSFWAVLPSPLSADVKVNSLFSDNMVLQQGQPIAIWGQADPDETVSVEFAGQKKTTQAQEGRWQVKLDPLAVSAQPQTLTIQGHNLIKMENVLVGEVWLASGQSNMGFPLSAAHNAATEVPQANDPLLRLFTVKKSCAAELQTDLDGKWQPCTPDAAKDFSAVAYFFGKELRTKLNCPVALINSSWGGTPAQTWMSMDALRQDPPFANYVAVWDKAVQAHQNVLAHPEMMTAYQADLQQWHAEVEPGYKAAMTAYNAALAMGNAGPKPKPSRPEPNNPDLLGMPSPSYRPATPSVIFNAMIAPLIPYGIKGVIWYQGEANGGNGLEYRTLFPRLITDWRTRFQEGDFPFLYVQLAGWEHDKQPPEQHDWPWLREAQLMTLSLPQTGMAVIADIGNPKNVHPTDKVDVGYRLSLLARKVAYHENIQAFGPLYDKCTVNGNKVEITFKERGTGLIIGSAPWRPDGSLPLPTDHLVGFVIAGADKHWVEADAKIVGQDTVEVSSDQVANPVAVRYGWDNSPQANLYNREGLAASPFRTDDWPKEKPVTEAVKTE